MRTRSNRSNHAARGRQDVGHSAVDHPPGISSGNWSRVILAASEVLVAEQMEKAAVVYAEIPRAMTLRAMNMTYESIKEKGALMVIPSGMANSFDTGVIGMAAAGFRTEGEPS